MEQMREISNRMERAIGDGARIVQRVSGATCRFDMPLRVRNLNLHRGQQLSNLVVELARDRAALLFLDAHELRRQPLQVARILAIAGALLGQVLLESAGVERGRQRDAEAGKQGNTE